MPAFSVRWRQGIDADEAMLRRWEAGELWTRPRASCASGGSPDARAPPCGRATRCPRRTSPPAAPPHVDPASSWFDGAARLLRLPQPARPRPLVPAHRALGGVVRRRHAVRLPQRRARGVEVAGLQPSRQGAAAQLPVQPVRQRAGHPARQGPRGAAPARQLAASACRPGDPSYVPHGIPFSSEGLYVHLPRRGARQRRHRRRRAPRGGNRPWLDVTRSDGPTLYLNAIMYRPYLRDPPGVRPPSATTGASSG